MHEASLVRSLLNQVEEIRRSHQAASVEDIRIEVGPLSGVEPLLVNQAFDQLKIGTPFANTSLTIDHAQLTAACRQCELQFDVQDFQFYCPRCQSSNVQVISGDQFVLVNVTVQCDEPENANEESAIQ